MFLRYKISIRFLALVLFSLSSIMGCSLEEKIDERIGLGSTISIGLSDIWGEDSLNLTSTVDAFSILVTCDGGYTQIVTTSEFSLPIRNTNCIAKLQSFVRSGNRRYEAKSGSEFVTWLPNERAVFHCVSGLECESSPDLNVYVLKQLPKPNLTVFAEVRYKFSENTIGDDIVIQKSDINFSKVVVGDEPPPFTLRAAYDGAQSDQLEIVAECDEFQIGGNLADAICATTSIASLRVALVPMPSGGLTEAILQDLMASSSRLLASDDRALLISHGQFGIGRGGFSVALVSPESERYVFVMTTTGSDSYTYHMVVRKDEDPASFLVAGSIAGLRTGQSLEIALNGSQETFEKNGAFSFQSRLRDLEGYEVTVSSTDLLCAVANGEGFIDGTNVENVQITCESEETTLEQINMENPFISTWRTDLYGNSGDNQVTLPLLSTGQ
jgi:hypothetical protein